MPHYRAWVMTLFNNIEALKFASDWQLLTGIGSKKAKRKFYAEAFIACSGMTVPEGADRVTFVTKSKRDEYDQWKKYTLEKEVTGRNRLLLMYHLVSEAFLHIWHTALTLSSSEPTYF